MHVNVPLTRLEVAGKGKSRARGWREKLKTPILALNHHSHTVIKPVPPSPSHTAHPAKLLPLHRISDLQAPVSEEAFGHSRLSESHCEGVECDVCDCHLSRTNDGSPDVVRLLRCSDLVWSDGGGPPVCPFLSWTSQGQGQWKKG